VFHTEWGDTRQIEVDPELLVDQPPEAEISEPAGETSNLGPSAQDMHWFIAKRRPVYDLAKAAIE
jgi:hypothetical protein